MLSATKYLGYSGMITVIYLSRLGLLIFVDFCSFQQSCYDEVRGANCLGCFRARVIVNRPGLPGLNSNCPAQTFVLPRSWEIHFDEVEIELMLPMYA